MKINSIRRFLHLKNLAMGDENEKQLILSGRSLALLQAAAGLSDFNQHEFRVFSQFGDDGLINHVLNRVSGNIPKIFVEFGVQDYTESNTRFLLLGYSWTGLIIDGSEDYISSIKRSRCAWSTGLTAKRAWITAENINDLIVSNGISGEIGILSIDIDGNDYWIWNAINCVQPVLVIIEMNALFGSQATITIPYKKDFDRMRAHFSGQFYGASLAALTSLGEIKGYKLVGINNAGNNAYFVRSDRLGALHPVSPSDVFHNALFNDTRNENGELTFPSLEYRRKCIEDLQVVDVRTGVMSRVGEFIK